MKSRILLFFMLSTFFAVHAQEKMTFSYDAAGNRVSRVMVLAKSSAKSRQTALTQSYFDEVGGKQVKIYPNSSTGHVLVEILGIGDASVFLSVYNTSGMQVFSQSLEEERLDIDLSSQTSGIYVLNILVDGEKQSWKIVKK